MRTIEVDFDVFKALTTRRPSEDVTENDVLRELLGLAPRAERSPLKIDPVPGDWIVKGVRFPAGTEFRAVHKGSTYLARVEKGALTLQGKQFDSPSGAAVSITHKAINGWRFWQYRFPGESRWQLLETLRDRSRE